MKIKDLFSNPSTWMRFDYAVDAEGNQTYPSDANAVCWCLSGAITKCYGDYNTDEGRRVRLLVADAIVVEADPDEGESDKRYRIPAWNDNPHRTFNEVQQLVERLDI